MSPWRVCINQCLTFPWETGQSKHWVNITWVFILSNHSFQKKITYQEVLKQRFFISNVENCVSTVNNIKWFWGIICCCYVSNHKFNLKTQRTTWKFSAWATKFRNTFILQYMYHFWAFFIWNILSSHHSSFHLAYFELRNFQCCKIAMTSSWQKKLTNTLFS